MNGISTSFTEDQAASFIRQYGVSLSFYTARSEAARRGKPKQPFRNDSYPEPMGGGSGRTGDGRAPRLMTVLSD